MLVFVFAEPLMLVFVRPEEVEILATGVEYLRIEGTFYCGIGILFLLYGYYRAIRMPGMSVVLTVISLGTAWCCRMCLLPFLPLGWKAFSGLFLSVGCWLMQ